MLSSFRHFANTPSAAPSRSNHFRYLLALVLVANLVSAAYIFATGDFGSQPRSPETEGGGGDGSARSKRSAFFDHEDRGTKVIHFVRYANMDIFHFLNYFETRVLTNVAKKYSIHIFLPDLFY